MGDRTGNPGHAMPASMPQRPGMLATPKPRNTTDSPPPVKGVTQGHGFNKTPPIRSSR